MSRPITRHSDTQHNWAVMQQVYKFYNEQKFTDILFEFPNTSYAFTAHRLILAAASPYLLELFDKTDPNCAAMTITDVDADTFEQLVVFCYNGQTDITAGNAERMVRGAVSLRLDGVINVCVNYMMEHLNDFLLRKLIALEADIHSKPLETRIIDYIVENFKTVNENNEIFGLNVEQWKVIVEKVDANVVSQEDLFWAITRWYEYKPAERQSHLPITIGALKLTEFKTEFILKQIKPLPGCERLATEAVLKRRDDSLTWLAVQNWGEDWLGYKEILCYNQAKEVWEKSIRLEIKRYFFSTAFMENSLIFIGGRGMGGPSNVVLGYNLLTKEWAKLPPMQLNRNSVGLAVLNNYIYAIGGKDRQNNILYSVERYDWSVGRWENMTSLSTVRSVEGVTILNGDIYVVGKNEFERYNATTNRWVACSPLLNMRTLPGVTAHEGYIYALGGQGSNYKSAERYNPQRNEWTRIAPLNVGRRYICAASIGGQLWAFGGVIDPAQWDDTVEVYDMANDKWLMKKKLPVSGRYTCFPVPTKLVENL